MPYCSHCGQALDDGARFCPACGYPLGAPVGSSSATAQRSFIGWSFLTLLGYIVFWLPGFILNIIFLFQAGAIERRDGYAPAGRGCLIALMCVGAAWPFLVVVITVLLKFLQPTISETLNTVSNSAL